ncbi:MAG TPA: hypothetical protein DIU15_14855, partial [Deltaproteobacteria bacterium]|nr:hypothetical protein [Deltaproteobacteria bacterium]
MGLGIIHMPREVWMQRLWFLCGLLVALVCSGCTDKEAERLATLVVQGPAVSGIVQSAELVSDPLEAAADGQGALLLDFVHKDRTINQKVKVSIDGPAGEATQNKKGEGNQEFAGAPGVYSASFVYTETELASGFEGKLDNLIVQPGKLNRYKVGVLA